MENITQAKNGFWLMEELIEESVNETNLPLAMQGENFLDTYEFFPDASF